MEHLSQLNYVAVLVCTIIYFLIGATWYSPVLFSKKWSSLNTIDQEKGRKQMPLLFANAFFCAALASFGAAILISLIGIAAIGAAVKFGLLCGLCFAFTSLSMSYMFGQRSIILLLIDAGYHIVALTVISVVLSIWK
ncbi:MAG TPA: DUF1761 domain-containing protein [Bacteroidia bacterium]|jgi:hypothetical protein